MSSISASLSSRARVVVVSLGATAGASEKAVVRDTVDSSGLALCLRCASANFSRTVDGAGVVLGWRC